MTMCVGSSPELRAFQAAFPYAQLLSTYGSTETGGVITYHEPDATAEQRVTTCGTPFRGVEITIGSVSSGQHVASSELGEILVRGYSVLDGYLNDSDATAAALDAEGWLHTGDLGELDVHGHVRFHGRLKDMIKVGGENVSPAEIEALLAEHPAVAAAHVVAAPDALLDEVVAAFVELIPGRSATSQELINLCAVNLARYKVPRHVRFVDAWPMSATKVRKDELRSRIALELSGALPAAPRVTS
jgi:fatty-acyl-CoA synthase